MAKIEAPVNKVIASPKQYAYRSKITPHFQKPRSDKIVEIGFLRNGFRQRILDVPQCPIASESINKTLTPLRDKVRANAANYRCGATLLLRDSANEVITDPKEMAHETVEGISFEFGAGDFFQNNPHILPAFTGHVSAEASRDGKHYLADAYCGSGLFALTSASHFEKVVGIEINESAVAQAQTNAERNDITNTSFLCGRADAIFSDFPYPASEKPPASSIPHERAATKPSSPNSSPSAPKQSSTSPATPPPRSATSQPSPQTTPAGSRPSSLSTSSPRPHTSNASLP